MLILKMLSNTHTKRNPLWNNYLDAVNFITVIIEFEYDLQKKNCVLYVIIGGFPIHIKTEIRYL